MNNKYQEVFDKVTISGECLRKVKTMEKENKKIINFKMRYALIVAIILSTFFATNIISYAATGKTIGEHISFIVDEGNNKKELESNVDGKYIYENDNEKIEVNANKDTLEKEDMKVEVNVDDSGDAEISIK